MQKPTNRILSALLVLVMVLSMLPATVFATSETDALEGWNIALGDDIGVKFHLNSADYTVTATVNGVEVNPTISDKVATVNVAAAQMNDTIALTVKSGEETVHTGEYTVRQYAETILNGEYANYVKQMVKQMLNYGAAAQTYFAYNADNLANAGYELETAATVPTEVPEITVEDNLSGISLYGMSLVFRNKTAVRFYFTVSGDIADYTFSQGTPVAKDNMYYIEIGDINPQDLDKDITVSVNDGAMTVTYSPLNYIVRKYNNASSSAELKALVQALYGYHKEAQAYIAPSIVDVVDLVSHSNGWSSTSAENPGGVTFAAAENDAPGGTWNDEHRYMPVSSDVIKLIRDGVETNIANIAANTIVKYSATEYYMDFWPFSQKPMQAGDEIILEGLFYNTANDTYINIEKTRIILNAGNSITVITGDYINAGHLSNHSNGINGTDGIYATMTANSAPYDDWSIEYTPVTADAYSVIRDGETINIGIPGRGTLVKYSDTEYYLKLTQWCTDSFAFTTDDIFVISGFWKQNTQGDAIMKIEKTYLYYDGSAWVCSATEPVPETIYEVGVLSAHTTESSATGFYANGLENDAPYCAEDIWKAEYAPTSKECIQVIRNGETIYRTNTGAGAIIKLGGTQYYVKFDAWIDSTNYPLQAGDMIIIEGTFVGTSNYAEAEGAKIHIDKTYVVYDGSSFTFSATEPVPVTEVDCGTMSEHADGSVSEIYFAMSENAVPVDENAEIAYAGTVQLVSGEATSSVSANIYKLDEGCYYLELDGVELADGDYLVVEGAFSNADNGYILNITKTYVLVDGDALVYSTTEPVVETVIEIGSMSSAPLYGTSGVDFSDGVIGNIYGTTEANEAPFDGWNYEYAPVSAENLKLIRDGVTYNVGIPGSGTIVKFNETAYCVKAYAWTVSGSKLPLVPGDILVVEGKYNQTSDSSVVVNFAPTYILVTSETTVKLMSTMPNVVSAGTMTAHGNDRTANGFYAKTDANNAAYNTDWSLRYKPVAADAVNYVSGETTTAVANTGGEMLVKYSESEYFFEGWTLSGTFANAVGNTYIVNGLFYNEANDVYIDIDKTYVMITADDEVFYHIEGGTMTSHASGTGSDGIYATMAANSLPVNGWLTELAPATADAYKIIRNGETLSIGISGRGTLVKHEETGYYLKTSGWCLNWEAVTTNDIIVIEGIFVGTSNNADAEGIAMNISKTYIYYDGTAWAFSETEPEQKTVVDVVELGSHSNGWTSTSDAAGGLYLTAAENDAPGGDWSIRYTPVSTDAIQLIRDGETTNVANTGAETIVKYDATGYFVEFWPVSLKPILAGDQMIIDGLFYNATNDVYIDIERTYITFNENGTATVVNDADKYINAGAMSAYATQNWFGDSSVYFAMASNIAPAAEDWSVRYTPASAGNVKLVRNGETITIGNTGAETIVKVADGQYALALDSWWWSTYAPIVDGDQLIIEGEFVNNSNGYTLNIDKTYISFISKDNDDVVFSTAADTEFGEVLLPNTNDTLTIGMWNGSYHVFEDKQLKELQAAGITKIMGVDTQWIGTEDVNAWLDRVYSYGISVIFDLRSWDGATVPDYASHEGVLGFLMYDEPCATDFDSLAELKTKFDAVMPEGKLFYVNLFPECAGDSSLVGVGNDLLGNDDYDEHYVSQFLAKLDVEVLSWDNYSLLEGSGIRTDYYHNFEVMASKNVPMWYTMLSAGHGTTSASYATPTEGELRWQMAVAMTYGVQNIDHYVYVSHESDYSCMVEYDDADGDGVAWETTELYDRILQVDNEYLAWDNIFMAYDWVGVGTHSANTSNSMLTQLENSLTLSDYGIAGVSASENLLIGVFAYNGTNAYMVTNAGSAGTTTVGDGKNFSMADATVTLTLGEGSYKCVAIIDQGEISYVAVNADNTVSIPVSAYEGVFVIPVLN